MNSDQLLDQILAILRRVQDDKDMLQKTLTFLMAEMSDTVEPEIEIPEKYKSTVTDLAERLACGLTCFLNPETGAIEDVPSDLNDPEAFELATGEIWEESYLHPTWSSCITLEPLESHDSFKIMERFANQVDDQKLQTRLLHVLNHPKPFSNFKSTIDASNHREKWFDFKQKSTEEWVWNSLRIQLE